MTDRLQLLKDGQAYCEALARQYPQIAALASIRAQIDYLLALVQGESSDRSRLGQITIGVLTAREVEPLDDDGVEILYQIATLARTL